MSEYTKERWELNDLTCEIRAGNTIVVSAQDPALTIGDATRIVEAVNGCAGLNPAGYRAVVEALRNFVGDYTTGSDAFKNQALAALRLAQEGT